MPPSAGLTRPASHLPYWRVVCWVLGMRMRRPTRLEGFPYVGPYTYSLRFATFKRQNHFTNPALTLDAVDETLRTCDEEGFALIAYCFMPDHVHLAVKGQRDNADLRRFVKIAKQ